MFLSNLLSDAENVAAYERGKITARNAQQLKYELDEKLFRMKWTGGEDEWRTIEGNLKKWKQHMDDHGRESPREHVEKVAREWKGGNQTEYASLGCGNVALIDNWPGGAV